METKTDNRVKVIISLDRELLKDIDSRALSLGITRPQYIRKLLRDGYQAWFEVNADFSGFEEIEAMAAEIDKTCSRILRILMEKEAVGRDDVREIKDYFEKTTDALYKVSADAKLMLMKIDKNVEKTVKDTLKKDMKKKGFL